MLNTIKEKYKGWRYPAPAPEELFRKWCAENIETRANTMQGVFYGFKHVIEVDWNKIYMYTINWEPVMSFQDEYSWRVRMLGDHAQVSHMRGLWSDDLKTFSRNEIAGGDKAFVGTNNDADAIMIALKYK